MPALARAGSARAPRLVEAPGSCHGIRRYPIGRSGRRSSICLGSLRHALKVASGYQHHAGRGGGDSDAGGRTGGRAGGRTGGRGLERRCTLCCT